MKKMTCKQLGGACEIEFQANTFEDIAEMSKKHCMEMFQKGDSKHIKVMEKMKQKMQSPQDFQKWMDEKQKEFELLSEN